MKKLILSLLTFSILSMPAISAEKNIQTAQNPTIITAEQTSSTGVQAPKWEDYVPEKYQNPRQFRKGKSIAELSTGILLTELIVTAPIGIPMIVHSTTKLKNQGYYEKKVKFEEGLENGAKIENPKEQQQYYSNLLKECKLLK